MTQQRAARIVFVEDKPEHILLAKHALESEGFANKIDFFSTAEAALEFMRQSPFPDLIFIDLNLNDGAMQGEDLAFIMLKDEKFALTEVCLMSAVYASREKENEWAKSRIKFFLKKPLITDQLDEVVRNSKRLRKLIIVNDEILSMAA